MSRAVTLWRIFEQGDMALSDSFFATKREALDAAVKFFGVSRAILSATGAAETDEYTVGLETVRVEMTKAGVARALTEIPHR